MYHTLIICAKQDLSPWKSFRILCESPVIVFSTLNVKTANHVISTVGLKQTVPLATVDTNDNVVSTMWIQLTDKDPEIQFLKKQKDYLASVKKLMTFNDFISIRYECKFLSPSFCSVTHTVDSNMILYYSGDDRKITFTSTAGHTIKEFASGIGVYALQSHIVTLYKRWFAVCMNISQVSLQSLTKTAFWIDSASRSTICEAVAPSPVKLQMSLNNSASDGTYLAASSFDNNESTVLINISNTQKNVTCKIRSSLGWYVMLTSPTDRRVYISTVPLYENISLSSFIYELTNVGKVHVNNLYLFSIPVCVFIISLIIVVYRHDIYLLFMDHVVRQYRRRTSSVSHSEFHVPM